MEKISKKVVLFYVVLIAFTMAMILTAKGASVPFLQEGGLIQLLQLFGAITCVYGIAHFEINRKKAFWYIVSGLIVAMLGSLITAGLYLVLMVICMLFSIDSEKSRKEIDSLAKE